ncbi:hypothetical protein [Priestia koreensis]|uniref:hypothetical protein n=1 Tax=Priestia koreensis TaxID=284581 RepID=UPI00301A6E75
MNKIIKKLQIPGYETKLMIMPRENSESKTEKIPDNIQLTLDLELDLELDSTKVVSKA